MGQAIIANSTIGPVYEHSEPKKRDEYSHALSETASLADRIFFDATTHIVHIGYLYPQGTVFNRTFTVAELIDQYTPMIEEHVERRILFFFQQLIVCYQTKLHFESVGAKDQGVSAKPAQLQTEGQPQTITRNAAHSSTNPRLIAYDVAQWNAYKRGEIPEPKGFVFLKGTDYYRMANATMNMANEINEADKQIDFITSSKLREKSMHLVNEASQGNLSPEDGVYQFIDIALDEIQVAIGRLDRSGQYPGALRVLQIYAHYFTQFKLELQAKPDLLETILDVKISRREDVKRILQIRYKAIREAQLGQSQLIQKITRVQKEILKILGTDMPPNFLAAFRTLVIEEARTDADRQRLEKLLNFSPSSFEQTCRNKAGGQFTKFEKIKSTLSRDHIEKIRTVAREVILDMRSLRVQEGYQRADTIKTLRFMKRWTQTTLGSEIKKVFPNAASSQSTISRIENRVKLVTVQIAQEFSRVFDVDPGLFMPHFFYE